MTPVERPDPALDSQLQTDRNNMPEYTSAQWDELIKRLRQVINDPVRSREDRAKAQQILDGALRNRPVYRPPAPVWDDSMSIDFI